MFSAQPVDDRDDTRALLFDRNGLCSLRTRRFSADVDHISAFRDDLICSSSRVVRREVHATVAE